MSKLSKYFKRSEFACPCCGKDTVDAELLRVLEDVRTTFDTPVHINSAFRCELHNSAVGGTANSQHLTGKAADIWVGYKHKDKQHKSISPIIIHDYLCTHYPDRYGIGLYLTEGFVHIDVRSKRGRW